MNSICSSVCNNQAVDVHGKSVNVSISFTVGLPTVGQLNNRKYFHLIVSLKLHVFVYLYVSCLLNPEITILRFSKC